MLFFSAEHCASFFSLEMEKNFRNSVAHMNEQFYLCVKIEFEQRIGKKKMMMMMMWVLYVM